MKQITKPQHVEFVLALKAQFPGRNTFTRQEIVQVKESLNYKAVPAWITQDEDRRPERGKYYFPEVDKSVAEISAMATSEDRRGAPRRGAKV